MKVKYKDRVESTRMLHTALRMIGFNLSYVETDLIESTLLKLNEVGSDLDLRHISKIQAEHEEKWTEYFKREEKRNEKAS